MEYFDLTLPKSVAEEDPKIHKVLFSDFRKAMVDFPRELAERLVELGYGKWAPCNVHGKITVPQEMIHPLQFFFIILPTHAVKAVHVWSLVPEEDKPVPKDLAAFAENLKEDIWFEHDPEDLKEPTFDEEDELYDLLEPIEEKAEEADKEPKKEKAPPKEKKSEEKA